MTGRGMLPSRGPIQKVLSRLFGGASSTSGGAPGVVDVREAARLQAAGALLIDVRQPEEWRQGHAPNAVLIPLGSVSTRLPEIPKGRDVLLICRSGNRSSAAQRQLLGLGYRRVFNVTGGMHAWASAGLPVVH